MRLPSSLLGLLLIATTLVAAPSAHAEPESSVQIRPINTKCTDRHHRIAWGNGEEYYASSIGWVRRNRGTMYACWGVYKVADASRRWDWYLADLETVWYDNPANVYTGDRALLTQAIHSTQRAQDNTESATGTFTSSRSCSGPFSVGFSVGPFSFSSDQELCEDYTMTRRKLSPETAMWQTAHVGKATTLETLFVQKVYHRAGRPSFAFQVIFPQHRYRKDGEIYRRTYAGMKEIDRYLR